MVEFIQGRGYQEFTEANLEEAWQALQGKLKLKGSSTASTSTRRSSSVSTSRSSAPHISTEPSEDEAYRMPLEKLSALANSQLAERNQE
jgi:hypothetical protein